jgi:hypothetical protein
MTVVVLVHEKYALSAGELTTLSTGAQCQFQDIRSEHCDVLGPILHSIIHILQYRASSNRQRLMICCHEVSVQRTECQQFCLLGLLRLQAQHFVYTLLFLALLVQRMVLCG